MVFGYARCSTADQNLDWQIDELKRQGCERIFMEKFTGTTRERPELVRMIDMLRPGDTIVICELTRLSRSVKDLFDLVEQIEKIGANIRSVKEPWLDTTTPQGRLLFTIFSGVSQFERDLTHERTMEGLASARARGRLGGRPKKDGKIIDQALTLYDSRAYSVAEILKTTGISRRTLYKYINMRKEKKE
ncbi:MAG: recombinase family protein [Bacteroidetes bacterium]|uniref:Recombinase family protein n=1 Tax=Candidatus Cryptobacteroides avicola TaxID=2840757 RepID=A0A940DQH7_9BACT|nr:recombinase family protein [Candidatus Cryptobacteroides avicola]